MLFKGYLGIVNTKGIHVETIEEAGKALTKASQTLMHQLEVHEICL